jgi:hypothetical protein
MVNQKVEELREKQRVQSIASLNVLVDALKSTVSDYLIRAGQAEELAGVLLNEKLTPEQLFELASITIGKHVRDKANERAVHQQQILQTTSLAVNNVQQMLIMSDEHLDIIKIRSAVNIIVQGLATALGNMKHFEKAVKLPRSDQQSTQSTTENS